MSKQRLLQRYDANSSWCASPLAAMGEFTQPTPTMLRSPRLLTVLEPWWVLNASVILCVPLLFQQKLQQITASSASQRFDSPVSLFVRRPLCTGEATVDLPLTKDTTFPTSSSLQWTELPSPPWTRLHPVLSPGFDHNSYISDPLPARPIVFLTYATLQQ